MLYTFCVADARYLVKRHHAQHPTGPAAVREVEGLLPRLQVLRVPAPELIRAAANAGGGGRAVPATAHRRAPQDAAGAVWTGALS